MVMVDMVTVRLVALGAISDADEMKDEEKCQQPSAMRSRVANAPQ